MQHADLRKSWIFSGLCVHIWALSSCLNLSANHEALPSSNSVFMLRADVRVHGFRVTPSPASCAWRWWRPSLAASGLLEALTLHLPSGRRRSASRRRRRTSKTEQGWLFEHPYSNWGIWQRVFNKRRALHWACSICAERRAVLGENNWPFGRFFFFFLLLGGGLSPSHLWFSLSAVQGTGWSSHQKERWMCSSQRCMNGSEVCERGSISALRQRPAA